MALSSVRSPSVVVTANGTITSGILSVDVEANSYYAGNRFRIKASHTADVAGLWLAPDIIVTITAYIDGVGGELITGRVDSVEHDLATGLIEICGRDLTSVFVEARLEDTFVNQTASQVATKLAAAHGMLAEVSGTRTPIGQYYRCEHDGVVLDQFSKITTEWDLLSALARLEGFEVWVANTTLYFGPRETFQAVISVDPASSMRLRLRRHLTLATDIEVTVKSWNSQQQMAIKQVARTNGRSKSGRIQKYVYLRPNLTASSAATLAQRLLSELSVHERTIEVELPGDLVTKAFDLLQVSGTTTDFDQSYLICEIHRRFSGQNGFTQTVLARNSTEITDDATS